ncbi:MAG: 4-alpha-glucanotransferase [Actinomycetales bacterium]|nr:MAG: 4-alpha-glucanotransferase [Actinomycetales bacterium]
MPELTDTAPPPLELLQELARAYGVGTDFWTFSGELEHVGAETLTRVLASLGVDASSADTARAALQEHGIAPWRRLLPATIVMTEGDRTSVHVYVVHGDPVRVWVVDESGREWPAVQGEDWEPPREIDGVRTGRATFWLPEQLPQGWHSLHAETTGRAAESVLVVVPRRLTTADTLPERTGRERTWGLMTQLYSVRSSRSWGVGDIEDLADLAAVAGDAGADWVLVNPLHAAEPMPPMEASPYLPTTRRFFSPLYIRIEAIPEYGELPEKARKKIANRAARARAGNRDAAEVPRDAAYKAKLKSLERVYAVPLSPGRARRFAAFRASHGQGLEDFALWCVLRERLAQRPDVWAEITPGGEKAAALRSQFRRRIDYHCWLQWIIDEQLRSAQETAKAAGMAVGVFHDLAVGVHPLGSDSWALADVLAHDAEVGAPPDMYNQQGQNWSQPPWHPMALAEVGYAPFRDMLRTILRHAGGIRIDHVLGLFRLWWVPKGLPASQGAYVYYDHDALVGILCLEAERAGAVVVGEDLGTFEPWVRDYLAERGVLGTSILWFEYAGDKPLPPERYRRGCMASVNTHDLPPTAGYLAGEHVALRDRLGLLARPVEVERAADAEEQERVLELCRRRGLLPTAAAGGDRDEPPEQQVVEALYRLLGHAPSLLQGVALVDAVGEKRIQNQPGTDKEYPNWKVPLADADGEVVLIEDLATHERAQSLFRAVREALDVPLAEIAEPPETWARLDPGTDPDEPEDDVSEDTEDTEDTDATEHVGVAKGPGDTTDAGVADDTADTQRR